MELIERLFDDTLWMYTAIAGSIFGALFIYWIKDTTYKENRRLRRTNSFT